MGGLQRLARFSQAYANGFVARLMQAAHGDATPEIGAYTFRRLNCISNLTSARWHSACLVSSVLCPISHASTVEA